MNKTYSELITLQTFEERFDYLSCSGIVGEDTFGYMRYLNQILYRSTDWRIFRRGIILRDGGNEMGLEGYPISGSIYIHHIVPLTIEDLLNHRDCIFDENNVISVSFDLHNALHYGNKNFIQNYSFVERTPYDTCPWRN